MKVRFTRWYNTVLTALLGLLGFESCESESQLEYGVPQADYIVKGVVTDDAGNPIQGIKTKFVHDHYYGEKTAITDDSGNYEIQATSYPDLYNCQLIVEDIDGEANGGEFLSDTLDLSTKKPVQIKKGDRKWYEGTYELSQDVKMKKK